MSLKEKRILKEWENVDHINDKCWDDRIENLQILTLAQNNQKSHKTGITYSQHICENCNKIFLREARFKPNGKRIFCSRFCSGRFYKMKV